ncbi:ycf3-interacting protein 1, chloroplastic isoform X3 [Durio zibethinus]|uniref:Ycf3-interacting protein 1, chloroplastic isoform X3 n=1 Tax=Durio zibethinus TaxID=66656 RepID=A0A6P6ACF8_DURZI|nr:ycf3-interacting protein 1, chloroplastic isoform X3 [Durio zibethinus]
MGTLQASQVAFASTCSSSSPPAPKTLSTCKSLAVNLKLNKVRSLMSLQRRKSSGGVVVVVGVGKEDTQQVGIDEDDASSPTIQQEENEDLQWVRQIQRVLELLRKNRDMLFSEVKLTVMIEDPREVERRRLLGIEDPDSPTRDDLVDALEQVEAPKKKRRKSLYAKATDTGIDPKEAAKRLNIDWDSAAEIEDADISDETEVPPAVVCFFIPDFNILTIIFFTGQFDISFCICSFLNGWLFAMKLALLRH